LCKPIEIGSDIRSGGGVVICPVVKIGSKTDIGAGSVVTRDIPNGVFAPSNPCRVIQEITEYAAAIWVWKVHVFEQEQRQDTK